MNFSSLSLFDVKSIKVERKEFECLPDGLPVNKGVRVNLTFTFGDDTVFEVGCLSHYHDNWTDATKELNFSRLFPNTIIIENSEEMWNQPTLANH